MTPEQLTAYELLRDHGVAGFDPEQAICALSDDPGEVLIGAARTASRLATGRPITRDEFVAALKGTRDAVRAMAGPPPPAPPAAPLSKAEHFDNIRSLRSRFPILTPNEDPDDAA